MNAIRGDRDGLTEKEHCMDEDLIVTPDVPTQVHESPLYADISPTSHFPFNISGFEQINKQKTHTSSSPQSSSFFSLSWIPGPHGK